MNHILTHLVTLCFFTGTLLALPGAAPTEVAPAMDFGMEAASVSAQTQAGVKPDYGTFWVGPWTLSSGWGGPDKSLQAMNAAGVTPAVHFYYWGDDITPSCVENGCWSTLHNAQKDRAGWQMLAQQLVTHLDTQMGGKPVVIFLESEFNKGGIETYEPFDGYMADMADFIRAGYPAAQIVLGFGNWGSHHWGNFDRAAEASDFIGIQGMRGSTRDTLSHYLGLYESTLASAKYVQGMFGKPVFIQDLALSSYPEPTYLGHQEAELKQFFDNLGPLKQAGVTAILYRSWTDAANMDLKNYYGEAERHWGLHQEYYGAVKPAGNVWIAGVQAERASPAPGGATPVPSEPLAATFSQSANNNDWWVEVKVSSSSIISKVEASHGGKPYVQLDKTSWGTWAKSFSAPAGGEMTYRATDSQGRTASATFAWLSASVNQAPVAKLSVTASGLQVTADASASSDADGDTLSYAITFGDGAIAKVAKATHTYAAAGDYTVALTVSDGFLSSTISQKVSVSAPVPLAASFEPSKNNNDWWVEVKVASSSTISKVEASHDGKSFVQLSKTSWGTWAKSFHAPAGGDMTYRATSSDGRTASQTFGWLPAPNQAPVARLNVVVSGMQVTADASASSDANGDTLSYAITFGDGTIADVAKATHTYAAAGDHTVALTVSDGKTSATASQTITIVQPNRAPVAAFTATADGLSVQVDASGSSDPDGDVLGYTFYFGDGATAATAQASHIYAAAGDYMVTLTVNDGHARNTASQSITVVQPNRAPSAAFTATAKDLVLNVDASGSSDADGDALSYKFDFGDGTSAATAKASHTYAAAGTYIIALTVNDGFLSDTTSRQLSVSAPVPLAASFEPSKNNNGWWVEVKVSSSSTISKVEASHGGKPYVQLDKTSWGTWAKSFNAPAGGDMTYRATDSSGRTVSQTFAWLPAPPPTFTATFSPRAVGNDWWLETAVSSSQTIAKVEASLNGGAWTQLPLTNWGTYAKSMHAPDGTEVVFRATATNGLQVTSDSYRWK